MALMISSCLFAIGFLWDDVLTDGTITTTTTVTVWATDKIGVFVIAVGNHAW